MKEFQVIYYFLDGKLNCNEAYIMRVKAPSMIEAMNLVHNCTDNKIEIKKVIEVHK